jgi:hypothetical protein
MTRRMLALILALAAVALFAAAAQAKRPPGPVRSHENHARVPGATIPDVTSVPYGGGPVLQHNRTHLIFWQPTGSGLTFVPGYETLIETFLRNVAAASRSSTSTYGLTGQYTDESGPALYDSIYGGALVDTDPLPPNGCTDPASGPPGWTVCLTDAQLQREIERVVRSHHLPDRPTDVYFLVTPDGLGDCADAASTSCALGGPTTGYCGYHNQTNDGLVLYAVIPYNAVAGHCQSNNPRPNNNPADPAISTISHEQIETITDPLGNAWVEPANGEEIADLCLSSFGSPIGGSGDTAWNEDINGGHYYLQEVWSNFNGGCEPRGKPDSVSFQAGLGSGHGLSIWFRARGYDPQGRIVSYRWSFGDGRGGTGLRQVHRFARTGRYHVVLRTTDSWGNWAYYAATLTVGRTGGQPSLVTNPG